MTRRRIAVVSDIHGNLDALQAVIARIHEIGCDEVYNLGDHLSGPLEALATADLLMSLDWKHVRGNQDRQLIDRPAEAMGLSDRAAHAQLAQPHFDWLRSLPLAIHSHGICAMHAAPQSDLHYLLERVDPHGVSLASQDSIAGLLRGVDAPLILTGHSHVPRLVCLAGGRTIVNPGSVGLPAYRDDQPIEHRMETGSPHARFAVVEVGRAKCSVVFHAVEYDWQRAARLAVAGQRPDWAHALATGFVPPSDAC